MVAFLFHLLLAISLAIACIAPAGASGPIEVRRDKLPKPIARVHTCVKMDGRVEYDPAPMLADSSGFIFTVSCPASGEGVQESQSAEPVHQQQDLVLYLARDEAGTGARRLSFSYLLADGREATINIARSAPSIGWSTRAQTSKLNGAAFFDMQRRRLPLGEFHLTMKFRPIDRPHVKDVIAAWHVTRRGDTKLIYWAETTEELRGEYPHWIYPQYTIVLDNRPN
jgi:hypothetical protein